MALVQVSITINEDLLSDHAIRVEESIKQKARECYYRISLLAIEASQGRGPSPILARVHFLLEDCINNLYNKYKKKQADKAAAEEVLPKHTLLCQCGRKNCLGYTTSIDTYVRKINAC